MGVGFAGKGLRGLERRRGEKECAHEIGSDGRGDQLGWLPWVCIRHRHGTANRTGDGLAVWRSGGEGLRGGAVGATGPGGGGNGRAAETHPQVKVGERWPAGADRWMDVVRWRFDQA